MHTSEVLNRAADLIEERGWSSCSGWPGEEEYGGPSDGHLCLEGGIMAALGMTFKDRRTSGPAMNAVREHLAIPAGHALFCWNDLPDRTQHEVIAALRGAAVIEAAREDQAAAWVTYAELVTA